MNAETVSKLLKGLCEDRASARSLLGSAAFLKLCAAMAEGYEERFRLMSFLERQSYEPVDEPLRSKLRADVRRVLEGDMVAIDLLKAMGKYGSDFCDQINEGNGGNRNRDRNSEPARESGDVTLELIIRDKEEAQEAVKDLKRWLAKSERIIICDPYILHFSAGSWRRVKLFESSGEYVEFVANFIPSSARQVKLFGCGYSSKIKRALREKLKEGRQLQIFDTEEIHDRYIIKDNVEGRMIGTSIGGFGSKVFTVLPLPREDTMKLLRILYLIEAGHYGVT